MPQPIRLPLPFNSGVQKRYVSGYNGNGFALSTNANDSNDGYDERYPMATILAAYDSLPALEGGTIYLAGACYVGGANEHSPPGTISVPGQGLWIGETNINSTAPAGWDGWRPTKPVRFIGLSSSGNHGSFALPQAEIIGGYPGDVTRPADRRWVGIWLAANRWPMLFENVLVRSFGIPRRMGVDANPALDPDDNTIGGARRENQLVPNVWFRHCNFETPQSFGGADIGPASDLAATLFCRDEYCYGIMSNVAVDPNSDRRAGWLCHGAEGNTWLDMFRCGGTLGGVKYYAVPGTWGFQITGGYVVESDGVHNSSTVVKLIGAQLGEGNALIEQAAAADSPVQPLIVDTTQSPGILPSQVQVVPGGLCPVAGPMTMLGSDGIQRMPLAAQGAIGFQGRYVIGESDMGRFSLPVITNRFSNMVPQRDGAQGLTGNVVNPPDIYRTANRVWTQSGSSGTNTVNSPIADRRGTTTAINISTNDGSPATAGLFQATQNCAAGDVWVIGVWTRASQIPLDHTPVFFQPLAVSGAPTFTDPFTALPFSSDAAAPGQWQWTSASVRCLTAGGGATAQIGLFIQAYPGQAVDVDPSYVLVKIPAGTMSPFELANFVQNLQSFVQGAVGAATTQPGQMMIAQGGLGVGNAVAATTPGSVVKKVEIFDATGASLGFVPVYSTIT